MHGSKLGRHIFHWKRHYSFTAMLLLEVALAPVTQAETFKDRVDRYSRNPVSITPTPVLTPTPTNTVSQLQEYHAFNISQNITIGRTRAEAMVRILQDQEMRKALNAVTEKGYELARENPELKSPAMVIAGAAALWVGRSVTLLRLQDARFSSRVSGRERSGSFSMESPILNGQFRFDQMNGAEVAVNRSVSSIDARAELSFNTKRQAVSTQVYHRIAPNLDLSVGASQNLINTQAEGTARIQYQIDF